MKKNFKLYGIIIFVVAIVILSITVTNFQKQSTMLREEVFDKCEMIALELKHTREYLAETMAIANMEHNEATRLLMPAIAGNEIGKKFYNATGYRLKQVSSKYRNPKNRPDKFEEKALAEFESDKNLSEYKGVDEIESKRVLRYLIPLHIEEACLKCHSAKETVPGFIQEDYPDDKATDYTFGDPERRYFGGSAHRQGRSRNQRKPGPHDHRNYRRDGIPGNLCLHCNEYYD